jgi:hypothetical protein
MLLIPEPLLRSNGLDGDAISDGVQKQQRHY